MSTAARVSVPAGRTVTVPFTLPVPQGGAGRRGLQFAFSASGRGHRVLLDTACHVWLVKGPRWTSKPDRPPAETSPPSGPEVVLAATRGDWVGLEGHAWAGPEDLSARLRLAWTPEGLLVSSVVRDDVHVQSQPPEETWRSDSLQLAFDYRCSAWRALTAGRPATWLELGLALDEKGRAMGYQWYPNRQPLEDVKFSVSRRGNETEYLAFVPASTLGAENLAPGDVVGFAALVNDDDGRGRKGWLALDDGIGFSKDPRKYGLLVLD